MRLLSLRASATNIRYRHEKSWWLTRLSLHVESGQIVLLEGESGSGKSTVLRLLLGDPMILADPASMVVYSDGPAEFAPAEVRRSRRFGFVGMEHPFLTWCSVREAIAQIAHLAGNPYGNCHPLDMIDLSQFKLSEALADKPPYELSYGQRRRFALLTAVLFNPEVVLIDEIFSGLDERNCEIIAQAVLRYATERGTTFIISTHEARCLAPIAHQRHRISVLAGPNKSLVSDLTRLDISGEDCDE